MEMFKRVLHCSNRKPVEVRHHHGVCGCEWRTHCRCDPQTFHQVHRCVFVWEFTWRGNTQSCSNLFFWFLLVPSAWAMVGGGANVTPRNSYNPNGPKVIVSRSHAGKVKGFVQQAFGNSTEIIPAGGAGAAHFLIFFTETNTDWTKKNLNYK